MLVFFQGDGPNAVFGTTSNTVTVLPRVIPAIRLRLETVTLHFIIAVVTELSFRFHWQMDRHRANVRTDAVRTAPYIISQWPRKPPATFPTSKQSALSLEFSNGSTNGEQYHAALPVTHMFISPLDQLWLRQLVTRDRWAALRYFPASITLKQWWVLALADWVLC